MRIRCVGGPADGHEFEEPDWNVAPPEITVPLPGPTAVVDIVPRVLDQKSSVRTAQYRYWYFRDIAPGKRLFVYRYRNDQT